MQKTNISTTEQIPITPQALNLNSQESANTISSSNSIVSSNSKILIIKVAPNTYLFKYNE